MFKDKNVKNFTIAGILLILLYWMFGHLELIFKLLGSFLSLISPFIAGGVIAFILSVPMNAIEKHLFKNKTSKKAKKIKRICSYFITLILLISLITVLIFVVVPQLTQAVKTISEKIPNVIDKLFVYLESKGVNYEYLSKQLEDFKTYQADALENLKGGVFEKGFGMIKSGIGVVSGIVSALSTFFIGFIVSIYILFQKEKLAIQLKKVLIALLPEKAANKIIHLASLTHSIFASFLSGQCLEAVILGTLFCVTMLILRLPYAFLIGILISVCSLVPIVGTFLAFFIGVFLILATVSPLKALIFAIMFLVLQQIEGQLIYPHVVGKSVGLPGLFVFTAVILGGRLFGALGMLVCIPLCSLFYCLFKDFINTRLAKKEEKEISQPQEN